MKMTLPIQTTVQLYKFSYSTQLQKEDAQKTVRCNVIATFNDMYVFK